MSFRKFAGWLSGITIALLISLFFARNAGWYHEIEKISYISIVFFVLLSIVIYFIAKSSGSSTNKNLLTQWIMILVFVKIFSGLVIIIAFDRIYHPKSNLFVLPFFLAYLIYTALEVWILTKASKMAP
jgi:hypothetical protein